MDKNRGMSRNLKTLLIVLGFLMLVMGATSVEMAVRSHQHRPLVGNVAALAILNLNVLLLALLALLLGRQFVKFYFEKKQSPFGAGFRSKLITAFIALTIMPAVLLVLIAGGLLTGGEKYWFGPRVEGTMRDSIALVQSYKEDRKSEALHDAKAIAAKIQEAGAEPRAIGRVAKAALSGYDADIVEVYDKTGG